MVCERRKIMKRDRYKVNGRIYKKGWKSLWRVLVTINVVSGKKAIETGDVFKERRWCYIL